MKPLFAALRSLVYGAAFVAAWGWLALRVRPLDSRLGFDFGSAARLPGAVLLGAGALLAITCVGAFVIRGQGTPAPFDPPRRFVVIGPYAWVRNPMYLGGISMLLGFALWHGSPAMILFTLAVWLLVHAFVVFTEEPQLLKRFGEPYAAYLARVRRWLPRPPDGS